MKKTTLIGLKQAEAERMARIYWGRLPLPHGHELRGLVVQCIPGAFPAPSGVWTRSNNRDWMLAGGVVRAAY